MLQKAAIRLSLASNGFLRSNLFRILPHCILCSPKYMGHRALPREPSGRIHSLAPHATTRFKGSDFQPQGDGRFPLGLHSAGNGSEAPTLSRALRGAHQVRVHPARAPENPLFNSHHWVELQTRPSRRTRSRTGGAFTDGVSHARRARRGPSTPLARSGVAIPIPRSCTFWTMTSSDNRRSNGVLA